jgi:hypothetical protein
MRKEHLGRCKNAFLQAVNLRNMSSNAAYSLVKQLVDFASGVRHITLCSYFCKQLHAYCLQVLIGCNPCFICVQSACILLHVDGTLERC